MVCSGGHAKSAGMGREWEEYGWEITGVWNVCVCVCEHAYVVGLDIGWVNQ